MSKKAVVILANGFEEVEATTVIDILRRASIDVEVAGLDDIYVTGGHDITIKADKILDAASASKSDACIFPGGSLGSRNLAESEKVKELLLSMNAEGKLIAAICASPAVVLAPLGLLDKKEATCFPGQEKNFSESTVLKEDAVVVDDNIITGRGPANAAEFAFKIVEILMGKEASIDVEQDMLFK